MKGVFNTVFKWRFTLQHAIHWRKGFINLLGSVGCHENMNFCKLPEDSKEAWGTQSTATAESLHISVERLRKRFPWQQNMKTLKGFRDPSSGEVHLTCKVPAKQDLQVQGDILLVWRSVFKGCSSALMPQFCGLSNLTFFSLFLKDSERYQKIQNCHKSFDQYYFNYCLEYFFSSSDCCFNTK